MNNLLRKCMCAHMSLVPELPTQSDNGVDRKIADILEEVRNLLKNIHSNAIEPSDAAKTALEISNASEESYQALRYLEDRLRIVQTFLSEVESVLAERTQ
jgi:hypothetical protein